MVSRKKPLNNFGYIRFLNFFETSQTFTATSTIKLALTTTKFNKNL